MTLIVLSIETCSRGKGLPNAIEMFRVFDDRTFCRKRCSASSLKNTSTKLNIGVESLINYCVILQRVEFAQFKRVWFFVKWNLDTWQTAKAMTKYVRYTEVSKVYLGSFRYDFTITGARNIVCCTKDFVVYRFVISRFPFIPVIHCTHLKSIHIYLGSCYNKVKGVRRSI